MWKARAYLALSVIVPFAVLDFAYVFSVWNPFTLHIDTSLNRLVLQQIPGAMLFVALQCADQFKTRSPAPIERLEAQSRQTRQSRSLASPNVTGA